MVEMSHGILLQFNGIKSAFSLEKRQFSRDNPTGFPYNVVILSKLYQSVMHQEVAILRRFAQTCGGMTDYLTMFIAAVKKECS
jgi:hypothetical protein